MRSKTLHLTIPRKDARVLDVIILYDKDFIRNHTEIEYEKNTNNELYRNYKSNKRLLNDVSLNEAKLLTYNWKCKRIICFIITISDVGFEDNMEILFYCFQRIFEEFKLTFTESSLLGVLQSSPASKGYHLHLLHISTKSMFKKDIEEHSVIFNGLKLVYQLEMPPNQEEGIPQTFGPYAVMCTGKIVKSAFHIYDNLQKSMLSIFCNDSELLKAFMFFKKEYVFLPLESQAKYQKLNNHNTIEVKEK